MRRSGGDDECSEGYLPVVVVFFLVVAVCSTLHMGEGVAAKHKDIASLHGGRGLECLRAHRPIPPIMVPTKSLVRGARDTVSNPAVGC